MIQFRRDVVVISLTVFATSAACLAVLLALGLLERVARDRAWRAVPIRVHVNGTRGKSTVTRLIWAALREAGIPAMAKTTGTAARLLLPDGSERPVVRRAPASIREQLWALRQARRRGARALVVECMALDPELQAVSERDMVRATVNVITNARLDHTEVMGPSVQVIAASLAHTIPRGGLVVCGEDLLPILHPLAERLGARVVGVPAGPGGWLDEDYRVALEVTRALGIRDDQALRGFKAAPADPGAATWGEPAGGRLLRWLDATAANDPESLERLVREHRTAWRDPSPTVVVYNHRDDRSARFACFARHSSLLASAERLFVTGDRPPLTAWRALARVRGGRATRFVPNGRLETALRGAAHSGCLVFCGNTRGFDVPRLLRGVSGND